MYTMSSSAFEMDQQLAQRLLVEGATLVLLDVPTGTDFGIDLKSWNTAEDFKGVKMIPSGFHYIHYSPTNEYGDMAPRIGFFHLFEKSECLVKRWNSQKEDISAEPVPEETINSLKTNLKELDKFLGPYPYDIWKQWNELTYKIDGTLVSRCSPDCGFVHSALELEHCTDALRPRAGDSNIMKQRKSRLTVEDKEEQLLPDLKPKPGTELRLSKLPEKHYPDGATPTEITMHSLDSSYMLDFMLNKLITPMEIIGEMQLAFVCFLAGQSMDAFEQWKKLISVICSTDAAISSRRTIYIEFLKVLEIQMSHVAEEILCDIVANNNFVYHNLRKLFANIELSSTVDDRLKCFAMRFRGRLTKKFLWDFSDLQEEAEDEAPVIVALD